VLGLALKDFALALRERSLLLMALLSLACYPLLALSPPVALMFSVMPLVYVVGAACAYDYKYRADAFLNSLPLSKAAIVGSKYLAGAGAWLASFVLCLVGWLLARLFGMGPSVPPFGFCAIGLCIGLVANAVYLGVYFTLGFEKARWSNLLVFGGLGAAGAASGAALGAPPAAAALAISDLVLGLAPVGAYAAAVGAGIAASAASFAVALASYHAKEY
jgi:hypothetical protein